MINLEKVKKVKITGKEKIKNNFCPILLFKKVILGNTKTKSNRKAGIKYEPINVSFVQKRAASNVSDRSTK